MGAVTRCFWFASCAAGVVGLQLAVGSGDVLQRPSLLVTDWWWLASLTAAAVLVKPVWGSGVAGLAAGGMIAVAFDRHLVLTDGLYWSPGFVGLFVGGIAIAALLATRIVRVSPNALAEVRRAGRDSVGRSSAA